MRLALCRFAHSPCCITIGALIWLTAVFCRGVAAPCRSTKTLGLHRHREEFRRVLFASDRSLAPSATQARESVARVFGSGSIKLR